MREICTSGSVRGEGANPLAYSTRPCRGAVGGAHPTATARPPILPNEASPEQVGRGRPTHEEPAGIAGKTDAAGGRFCYDGEGPFRRPVHAGGD